MKPKRFVPRGQICVTHLDDIAYKCIFKNPHDVTVRGPKDARWRLRQNP